MKTFKYLDAIGQTIILAFVIIMAVVTVVTESGIEAIPGMAMYGAILLGPWQMVSSLASMIRRSSFFKQRLTHFIAAVSYLVVASMIVAFTNLLKDYGVTSIAVGTILFSIPVVLAFFYYYITIKSIQLMRTPSIAA